MPETQSIIDRERFGERVRFEHVNHDELVRVLGATQPVKETIQFAGKALVEDIQFVRVFIGKVGVTELARIITRNLGTAAEAVLSVWRRRPQQARFRSSEHFGKLYSDIFTADLTAAQVVTAVLLLRIAENKRKRPPAGAPDLVHLPHGSQQC